MCHIRYLNNKQNYLKYLSNQIQKSWIYLSKLFCEQQNQTAKQFIAPTVPSHSHTHIHILYTRCHSGQWTSIISHQTKFFVTRQSEALNNSLCFFFYSFIFFYLRFSFGTFYYFPLVFITLHTNKHMQILFMLSQ